ncbi:MAG: hypothetical protein JSU61_00420 [Fidelibacterota bacterium]|nr:MAG: hypothetical protein JSU61_00420 [Candidatus Neomarinimicrobiota bacterium]
MRILGSCITYLFGILVVAGLPYGTAARWGTKASNAPVPRSGQISPGTIIERVLCLADPAQSYALYLPSGYTPQKAWPIIYAFDAGARGSLPVERFREAAETYGHIIVGSNNSRNGPWGPNFAAAEAMWTDTHARFSLDTNRVYATGFSGGARVACEVAYKPRYKVAGVIAHGAGFRQGHGPSINTPFIFFGTAGNEDFNLLELQDLQQTLDTYGIANGLVTFDGPHDWAPDTVCTAAVEWMELLAMKTGRCQPDERLIELIYEKRLNQARMLEKSGDFSGAFKEYQAIILDFTGLRDVADARDKATQLEAAKEVKRAKRREAKRRDGEREVLDSVGRHFAAILNPTLRSEAVRAILKIARKNAVSGDRKSTPEERHRNARIRNYITMLAYTNGAAYLEKEYYPEAVVVFELWTEIEPEQHVPYYYLARAYSTSGECVKALQALESAVEKGFNDLALMERDPYLVSLSREERYQQLVRRLEGTP